MRKEWGSGMKAKRAQRTVAGVLFITLLLCTVYALIRFLLTSDAPPGDPHGKLKSDYLLMLVQCCLGLVVMTLPTVFSRKLRLMVPGVMCILYYVFLYAAIILGEILSFYHLFPGIWDSVLHAFSAAMLATLGFILVDWMNKESHIKLSMNPAFVALFAFSFAVMVGTVWEIYEFAVDGILRLNMQHYATPDMTPYVGRVALLDTMKDIILDVGASLCVSLIGFFTVHKKKRSRDVAALCANAQKNEGNKEFL